jgi:protein gp37
MGDLFHPQVPFRFICDCFVRMGIAKQHTFQVLTKRPERALEFYNARVVSHHVGFSVSCEVMDWPLPNVQMIVTAENQKRAYERIPVLLQIPAAVHGVSIEPMLGEMDLTEYLSCERRTTLDGIPCEPYFKRTFGTRLLTLDWVIVGGESGPGARMTNPSWIRSILDQCKAAGVPFFMKQAGEALAKAWGCKDRKGGNPDEWPEEFRVREFPK